MKNFTAALLSFYESVVSNSRQSQTVQHSEAENVRNNRANPFNNISSRNFLWGFYGIFLGLFKFSEGTFTSPIEVFSDLGEFCCYLNLVMGRRIYLNFDKAYIANRSLIGVLVALLIFGSNVAQAQCTGTSVVGTVFRDFNLNGVKDNANEVGLAGVTVKAFNPTNAQVGITTTTIDGTYNISGLSGNLRVEFSGLPTDYVSGPDGSMSGTSVQFVTLSSTVGCAVNFGVNHPDDFCAKSGIQPKVAVPCYANGAFSSTGTLGAGLEDALVSFPYNRTGDKATSGNAPNLLASYNRIGSVWGMAYNKYGKTLFATAFMKRHSGFGPQGIAGLYVVQNADVNGLGTVTGINLQTLLGINAGTQPTRNLSADKTQPTDDGGNAVFDAVGKMSFGDCELSEDGNTLYITNLFDKKVYALNVTTPLSPTLIGSYLVPNPGCSTAGEYYPFGLKVYRGKVYVGVICTAQSLQPTPDLTISSQPLSTQYGQSGFDSKTLSSVNLKASVYELSGSTFTSVLSPFSLNYDRGKSNSSNVSYAIWRPWVSTYSQVISNRAETYPQPILSNIEFDTDGSMILGFLDRFSHQLGNANYAPETTSTVTGRVEGDVMRATKGLGSTWSIENNGVASGITTQGTNKGGGPGGGEYYFGDLTIDHDEPAMGGLALYPGTGEIITTIAGSLNIFYSGGTRRMNNNTGDYLYSGVSSPFWNTVSGYRLGYGSRPTPTGDYKLYEGQNPATFGKASGLGDIEVLCSLAPLEIGNRIWRDYNRNGIQDAGEPGIANITVLLFKGSSQVASATTNSDGEYYFNDLNITGGLLPNMAYEIRVATNQIGNTFLSPTNAAADNIDSDALNSGGNAVITLTTGGYGVNNHTYDIGFSPNCPTFANPQPNGGNVTVCSGITAALTLTVNDISSQPLPVTTPPTNIQWVTFSSVQSDPYTLIGRTVLSPTAALVDGTFATNINFPANTGTVPIVYYVYAILNPTPDGGNPNCRPSVAYIVTVNPIPAAPITITGGGVFCKTGANSSFPLTATCAINTTPVWYVSQTAPTGFFIGDTYNVTVAGTYTYYVSCKATSAPNCETASVNRKPITITVNDSPAAPTVSVQGGSNAVCGTSATLNGTCAAGSGLIPIWSTGTTATSITVNTSGTYTAKCISAACSSPNSADLIVNIIVNPSTPIISGGNLSVCKDVTTSLTAKGCLGTYNWSNGGTGSTISVPNGVVGTISYTVTCMVGTCISNPSAGVSVTVNPIPLSPTGVTVNNGAICIGSSVVLSATCLTNETAQWYEGSAIAPIGTGASLTYKPNSIGSKTYAVGCRNNTTLCETKICDRKPLTVIVNSIPTKLVVTGAGAICPGSSVTLTASACDGTYLWNTTTTTSAITVTTAGTFTVTCTKNGCTSLISDNALITLNPNVFAPTDGAAGNGDICMGEQINLSATCAAGQTPQWYNNNAGNTSQITVLTFTPAVGNYSYYVGCKNSNNSCETLPASRALVTLKVNPVSIAPKDQTINKANLCLGESVNLSATCATNQTAQWYEGATFLGTGNITFIPTLGGHIYSVGCKNNTTLCETKVGDRTSVGTLVTSAPVAPKNANVKGASRCDFGTVTLTATCDGVEIPQWYNTAGTFVFAGTAYSPTLNTLGNTIYTVGCKSSSNCETPMNGRVSVTGTANLSLPAPASDQVTGGKTCGQGTVELTASCSTGQKPQWYNNTTTTEITLFEGNTYITANITQTITYYVGCKDDNTGCETLPINRRRVVATFIREVDNGGQVAKSQVYCGPSQPVPFISLAPATGSSTTVEYLWLTNKNTTDTVFNDINESLWIQVAGATGETFTPPFANATIAYIRCARSAGCIEYLAESNVLVIRIYPIPTPPTNITINKSTICLGESVSLSATCGTNQTANWYEGTTLLGSGNIIFVPTVGGHTYNVSCQNETTVCETADINRVKVTLIVNPIPATPQNPTINKAEICIGETVNLSATCGTNETAQWYEGMTTIGTSGSFTYTPTALGSNTYTVGCKNNTTLCETKIGGRKPVTLQVNPIPAAPTAAMGGAVCGSGSIDLTATCAMGTVAVWYNTQIATTSLSVGNTFNVAVTANKTYYVACRSLTTPTQCESPADNRKAVEVIFNNNPVPTASATPNAICVGGSTKLKVNETFTTYAWKGPNGFANTNQSIDINNVIPANTGVYTVTISAAGGCTASVTVSVTVNINPVITASVTDNTVCQQSAIELKSIATAGTGTIIGYAWTGPNIYTAGIQNPTITTATSAMTGNYTVKVTDSNNCTATSQVSVIINPLPTATASSEGGNTICLGASISFTASGAGVGGSYQWTGPAGSGFTETTQNPIIISTTLVNAGVYTLKITNSNGCTATSTVNIVIDRCLRVGNLVWEDTNNNGVVDGTEAGVTIPVKVELFKANQDGTLGAFVATQNTAAGIYLFSGLEPGDYIVQITAPAGYKSSTGTNGSTTGAFEPAKDVDLVIANNQDRGTTIGITQVIKSLPVTLNNFDEPTNEGDDNNGNLTVDFGIYQPSKIGDFVFNDDNRNGQQEDIETGVAGVMVNLYDLSSSTIPVATATTDANGKYLFDNLKPGSYVVEFVKLALPNDKQFTTKNVGATATDSDADAGTGRSNAILLGVAQTNLTIDAGIQCPLPTPTTTTTTEQVCVGGTIKLKAMGGKAYSWKGPNAFSETTAEVTINNAIIQNTGTYTVTVMADNQCNATALATVSVIVNPNPTVSATGSVVCTEESINLKAEGNGTFSWKGPNAFSRTEQNPIITGATTLKAGIYTVTVTNGSSCNVSTTVNVTVNKRPIAPTETDKNKSNICDGETLSLSGVCPIGTTIKWYKADGTVLNPSQNFNPGPVGTYSYYAVCKSDLTSCETTNNLRAKVTIMVDGIPIAVTPATTKGVICLGESVSLSANCGSGAVPVWYIGNPTTPYTGSLTNIAPPVGTYLYLVSCKSTTGALCETPSRKRLSVTLTVKANPVATATVQDNTVCTGSTIKLVGGDDNLTYAWSGPFSFTSSEQKPSIPNAIGANTGNYTMVVSNNGNCSASAVVSVTVLVNPVVTATGATVCVNDPINLTSTPNLTGTITGNIIKEYTWTGPNNFTDSVQNPSITNATTLNGGVYTVTVTDNNGCTAIATTTVIINELPVPTANNNGPACVGTTITLTANLGFTKYNWVDSKNAFVGSTAVVTIPNAVIGNEGIYTVTVTNTRGCTATATTEVKVNTNPNPTITPIAAVCLGSNIVLSVSGTTANTYAWNGSGFTSTEKNPTVTPTTAGTYTYLVTVSGLGGCTGTATTSVIVKPNPILTVSTASICTGTTGKLTASGADSYAWSNTDGGFITISAELSVTKAGVYTVIGTTNGCTATATTNVSVKAIPTVAITPITLCASVNGKLKAEGSAVDTYSWSSSNIGFTATTQEVAVSQAGTYIVLVTKDGCTAQAITTVDVKPNIILTISTASICAGTTTNLTVNGASTYSWSGPGVFTATGANPVVNVEGTYTVIGTSGNCTAIATTKVAVKAIPTVTIPSTSICAGTTGILKASVIADTYLWSGPSSFTGTTQEVTVSNAGKYSVTISKDGCKAVATSTVEIKTIADIKATSAEVCTGGVTTLIATGGVTYSWTGPGIFTATGASPTVSVAGAYTVTGTDKGGCIGTATATLTIKDNPTVIITGNTVICLGEKTTLTASGTGTFTWTGTDSFTATTTTVEVSAGTYQATVINSGCSAVGTVTVINDGLSISASGAIVCGGGSIGLTGRATATSGIQSYEWLGPNGFTSTEQSPTIIKPTATGTYTLTVTSKVGCTATATAIITITPAVTNTASVTFCKGGKATLTTTGGTGATYLWTGGETTLSIEVKAAGTYNVTITDVTGCISKGIFTVTESATASVIITGNTSLCSSTSTKLTVNEGATGETYTWTGIGGFTSNSQMVIVSTPGDYLVLVKTEEGCEGTAKVIITAGFTPTAVCGSVCEGDSIRFSAIQLRGLTYSWSKDGKFVSSSADPKLLNVQKSDAGVYEVVITGFGCTATVVATLIVYEKPTGITATVQNSTCDQDVPQNNGLVKLAGTFTGLRYDIVQASSYTGTKKYADATDIPASGIIKLGITNPTTNAGTIYTVRVFNANNCYRDYTITIQQVICSCSEAKCVQYAVIKTKSGKK